MKNKKPKQPSAPSSGHSSITVQRSLNIEIFGNQAESRSFCFFRDRTVPQLAGYFASDFWDCLLPLSTHYQPAIRHAVVALAALHERFENNDNSILSSNYDIAQGGFALQQYNRAIGCLIKPVKDGGDQRSNVALIACILFACFEVLFPAVATLWAPRLKVYLYVQICSLSTDSSRPLWVGHFPRSEWRQDNFFNQKQSRPAVTTVFVARSPVEILRSARNLASHICTPGLPINTGRSIAAPRYSRSL